MFGAITPYRYISISFIGTANCLYSLYSKKPKPSCPWKEALQPSLPGWTLCWSVHRGDEHLQTVSPSHRPHLPILWTTQSCWQRGQRLFCFTHRDMQQLWKEWLHSPHTTGKEKYSTSILTQAYSHHLQSFALTQKETSTFTDKSFQRNYTYRCAHKQHVYLIHKWSYHHILSTYSIPHSSL